MEDILGAPEGREIETLYSVIRQDPDFLDAFDSSRFVDTPLHLAADKGRTQLAVEIQMLMPSWGEKLNPDGFTPVYLALLNDRIDTARAMLKLNPELVGVQGREGITPLHFAAEKNEDDLLAEFLRTCPGSIEKLTARGESAVHLAVKYRNYEAFRALYSWLKKNGRTNLLELKDCNGDTALHLAASTNQPQVLKRLVRRTNVRETNSADLTALDIVWQLPDHVNGISARSILEKREKETTSCGSIVPHNEKKSFFEKVIEISEFTERGMSGDTRNALLVVAVLIATAAYQGVLSPPGGFSQGDNGNTIINTNNVTNYNTTNTSSFDASGKAVMSKEDFYSFMSYNSGALAFSLGSIVFLIPLTWADDSVLGIVFLPLVYLLLSYLKALKVISPLDVNKNKQLQKLIILSFSGFALVKIFLLYFSRWRVRSPRTTSTRPETP